MQRPDEGRLIQGIALLARAIETGVYRIMEGDNASAGTIIAADEARDALDAFGEENPDVIAYLDLHVAR